MESPDILWPGKSGTKYGYWIKKLPYSCNPNQNGNYIFAKAVNSSWIPVYIGQGDLDTRINDPAHNRCAISKGATHVHVHKTATESARRAEEQDLLAEYDMAYAPTGCNEREGG